VSILLLSKVYASIVLPCTNSKGETLFYAETEISGLGFPSIGRVLFLILKTLNVTIKMHIPNPKATTKPITMPTIYPADKIEESVLFISCYAGLAGKQVLLTKTTPILFIRLGLAVPQKPSNGFARSKMKDYLVIVLKRRPNE